MYSAYKLNKQGDNIQPWRTPFPIWNQSVVPCPALTVASWPAYRFLKRQVRWSGIPLSKNFPQFIVIHTVKGCGIVNKAEIDVFLELSCFFNDPANVGNLISGSSAFSKTSLNIWNFTVHILLRSKWPHPHLRDEGLSPELQKSNTCFNWLDLKSLCYHWFFSCSNTLQLIHQQVLPLLFQCISRIVLLLLPIATSAWYKPPSWLTRIFAVASQLISLYHSDPLPSDNSLFSTDLF